MLKFNNFISSNVRDTRYYAITYNNNYIRILKNKYQLNKGWEIIKTNEKIRNFLDYDKEETQRISLSRTKSRIKELALCNNFEYFGTITINGYLNNRYDLDECQNRLKKTLRNIRLQSNRKDNDFKYLIITEKHKDGAFHFHGLFSGLDLSLNEFGYLYNPTFSKQLGFNSFSPIKNYIKCCNYITKYITKDCVKNSHNQIYLRSKGLNFATKEEINPIDLYDNWKFDNDFCSIYDIDLTNPSELDKDILIKLLESY